MFWVVLLIGPSGPDRTINAVMLALIALPSAGFYVAARRYRLTGQWPRGRDAPWGMFWLLPIVFAAAASAATWSLWTMIDSMVTVPC